MGFQERSRTPRRAGRGNAWVRAFPHVAVMGALACASAGPNVAATAFAPALEVNLEGVEPLRPGLYVFDTSPGVGVVAERGDDLRVEYVGWLANGRIFDSSLATGEPLEFRLGANRVIDGWDAGLVGMREGGIRKLVLFPRWGYGMEGSARVPPNSVIVFEIQLLRVEKG